jgi:hypothetical protein
MNNENENENKTKNKIPLNGFLLSQVFFKLILKDLHRYSRNKNLGFEWGQVYRV